jgi:hypothetical protein
MDVPGGFANDSYPVMVQSGEQFAVKSRAEVSGSSDGGQSIDYSQMADALVQAMSRAGIGAQ